MSRSIGYARCSTTHQDTAAQTDELKGAGCVEVFAEKVSSRAPLEKRHQLRACLETLQKGDELVISKLDRLGRSQVEVIKPWVWDHHAFYNLKDYYSYRHHQDPDLVLDYQNSDLVF